DEARALEARVTAPAVPARSAPVPLPAARRSGTAFLLGTLDPQFTDADVRQMTALVPGGKKAWLVIGQAGRRSQGYVFLEPDSVSSALRKGSILVMEASVPTGANDARIWRYLKIEPSSEYAQVTIEGRDPSDVRGNDDINRPFMVMYFEASPKRLTDD